MIRLLNKVGKISNVSIYCFLNVYKKIYINSVVSELYNVLIKLNVLK